MAILSLKIYGVDSDVLEYIEAELNCFPLPHESLDFSQWRGVSEEDYFLMYPALILASRAMTSRMAFDFWQAFFFRPKFEVECLGGTRQCPVPCGTPHRYFQRAPAPQGADVEDEIAQIHRALLGMARVITCSFAALDEGVDAVCRATLPIFQNCRFVASDIFVHEKHRDALRKTPLKDMYRLWFTIGATILHESAHAMNYAAKGQVAELAHAGDGFVELGRALELCIFGSIDAERQYSDSLIRAYFRTLSWDIVADNRTD